MKIITDIDEMKQFSRNLKKASKKVSLVPTMGKLHAGHKKLVEEAKKYGETVVSIFVNPLQFAPNEDFDNYPRDIEKDAEILSDMNVSCLFYPPSDIVKNTETFLINPKYSGMLEGVFRPEHFQGVLTVVMKLFCIADPDFAFFGLKDYQQYVLIKKMAEDYFLGVKIIPVETVREKCGLAMSSRNVYFGEEDKKKACAFYGALKKTADLFKGGEKSSEKLTSFVIKELINAGFAIDYAKITDEGLGGGKTDAERGDILLAAVRFKGVRLLDNIYFI
jgi:pantoate--beta-alanine ligase